MADFRVLRLGIVHADDAGLLESCPSLGVYAPGPGTITLRPSGQYLTTGVRVGCLPGR